MTKTTLDYIPDWHRRYDNKLHAHGVCYVCRREFSPRRSDTKTCSNKCRTKMQRGRMRDDSRPDIDLKRLSISTQLPDVAFHEVQRIFELHGYDAGMSTLNAIIAVLEFR